MSSYIHRFCELDFNNTFIGSNRQFKMAIA